MHSHDRTLLANLGFADADKKNPKHDWACQYLCQTEIAQQILNTVYTEADPGKFRNFTVTKCVPESPISKGQGQYKVTIGFADVLVEYTLEGYGYRWITVKRTVQPTEDDIVQWTRNVEAHESGVRKHPDIWKNIPLPLKPSPKVVTTTERLDTWLPFAKWTEQQDEYGHSRIVPRCFLCIEVKIGQVSVAEIIRQLSLYREHMFGNFPPTTFGKFIAVTAFPLGVVDVQSLNQADIVHFKLGQKFEAYCIEREAAQENETIENKEL